MKLLINVFVKEMNYAINIIIIKNIIGNMILIIIYCSQYKRRIILFIFFGDGQFLFFLKGLFKLLRYYFKIFLFLLFL